MHTLLENKVVAVLVLDNAGHNFSLLHKLENNIFNVTLSKLELVLKIFQIYRRKNVLAQV